MSKKMEEINLDDSFNMPLVEEPKKTPKAKKEEVTSSHTREEKELVNCLRKEVITVRYLPKASGIWGNNPKHVLAGGMAETATKTFVVPKLSSGLYVNVLTDDEKKAISEAAAAFMKANSEEAIKELGATTELVEEIVEDRSKLKVMVMIFGRKTLLELNFTQVTKE